MVGAAGATGLDIGHFCLTAPPAERFAAAARAGFAGITLYWDEVKSIKADAGSLSGFRSTLRGAGLRPAMMEYISLPAAEAMPAFAREAREIAGATAELGCDLVQCVALTPGASFATLVDGAGILAQACQDASLRCAVEFVPFLSGIPDLKTAVRLLHAVDMDALGLLVDSFHFVRAGAPWAELEALTPGRVFAIQVNDGPLQRPNDDYGVECMDLRRLPGDGEFDLPRFVGTLAAVAPEVPLMAEVVNRELLALPAAAAAQIIAEKTRFLQRAQNEALLHNANIGTHKC